MAPQKRKVADASLSSPSEGSVGAAENTRDRPASEDSESRSDSSSSNAYLPWPEKRDGATSRAGPRPRNTSDVPYFSNRSDSGISIGDSDVDSDNPSGSAMDVDSEEPRSSEKKDKKGKAIASAAGSKTPQMKRYSTRSSQNNKESDYDASSEPDSDTLEKRWELAGKSRKHTEKKEHYFMYESSDEKLDPKKAEHIPTDVSSSSSDS